MSAAMASSAAAFNEAVRRLDRSLGEVRGAWDDGARQTFDRRFGDRIVSDARRSAAELEAISQEVDTAMRILANLR